MLDEFRVFHDVPFDGFNFDPVIGGRQVVFAVETRTRRKPRAGGAGIGARMVCLPKRRRQSAATPPGRGEKSELRSQWSFGEYRTELVLVSRAGKRPGVDAPALSR
jgi:hypothetical protein